MDSKRFALAVVLSIAVIFGMQMLFPSVPKPPMDKPAADSLSTQPNPAQPAASQGQTAAVRTDSIVSNPATPATLSAAVPDSLAVASTPVAVAETTVVGVRTDSGAVFTLSNVGAAPSAVVMNAYTFTTPQRQGQPVELRIPGQPLVKYQLVTNSKNTVDLSSTPFSVSQTENVVTYQGTAGQEQVSFEYTFAPDGHNVYVRGTAPGIQNGFLIVSLPTTLPTTEKDTTQDFNNLGYVYLSKRDGARRVLFSSLDPGEKAQVEGPVTWTAAKNKYFVFGLLSPENGAPFSEVTLTGGARVSSLATQASADVVVPITNGAFAFDLYAGPQEWRRLHSLGRDFDEVNPYGWGFLSGFLQPIATMVIRLVLWMHQSLALSYGMVLVALGIIVRVILWPLNQTAMRTSLQMQEFQPKIQAVQAKYKDNVEKQRQEIMKLYQEHGMSPFSPFLGCLPMLLPMPVLFALFFVFQNTIEFRGVPFLWVNDLSTHDPYYIWPILMAASMYLLSWIGMRNAPANPQAKMISYIMPAMMLIFLGRLAAGLNVYYAAQNIAALPQQWFIAREQAKRRAKNGGGKTDGGNPESGKSNTGKTVHTAQVKTPASAKSKRG